MTWQRSAVVLASTLLFAPASAMAQKAPPPEAPALEASASGPAAGDPASTLLYACYVPSSGTVYRIKGPGLKDACTGKKHVEFSWNAAGVQGPQGEPGPVGEPGPPGPPGADAATSWTALTPSAGWTDSGGGQWHVEATRVGDLVSLSGMVQATSGNSGKSVIAILPAGYRPARFVTFKVIQSNATGDGRVNVHPSGEVETNFNQSTTAGDWLSLAGIVFRAAN